MNKNVPKLRFKEFDDEWINYLLGNFLEFYTTNSFSRDCLNMNDGKVSNIHYGDIHMKFPTILDLQRTKVPFINNDIDISKIKFESYCQDGDLIFADASEDYNDIGKVIEIQNIEKNKVVAGLHTILARDTKGVTTSKFKGYMMLNESVRKQIKVLAVGTKVLGISKSNLAKVKVNIPSLEEQERIGNFFSIIDKLIEEEEGKVRDLELYKKGMMQKIFKQEIRFKDDNGIDYPEWEEKKLGSLILYKSERNKGKQVSKVLSVSNKKGFIAQSDQFEDREVASSDTKNYKIVHKDDFAFNPSRINVGSIARLKNFDVGIISPMYVCFACIEKVLASGYFEKFIDTFSFKIQVKNKLEGSVRQTLSFNALEGIKIQLPCLEEQRKIANFFSNIDNLTEEEQKNLDDLREMKKGLLQQMFV